MELGLVLNSHSPPCQSPGWLFLLEPTLTQVSKYHSVALPTPGNKTVDDFYYTCTCTISPNTHTHTYTLFIAHLLCLVSTATRQQACNSLHVHFSRFVVFPLPIISDFLPILTSTLHTHTQYMYINYTNNSNVCIHIIHCIQLTLQAITTFYMYIACISVHIYNRNITS